MTFDCSQHCPDPGKCCRGFTLHAANGLNLGSGTKKFAEEALVFHGLPFIEVAGRNPEDTSWVFTCTRLVDGKCGDYDNRPDFCRTFQPGSGELCCVSMEELKNFNLVDCYSKQNGTH